MSDDALPSKVKEEPGQGEQSVKLEPLDASSFYMAVTGLAGTSSKCRSDQNQDLDGWTRATRARHGSPVKDEENSDEECPEPGTSGLVEHGDSFYCPLCDLTFEKKKKDDHLHSTVHNLAFQQQKGPKTWYGLSSTNKGYQMLRGMGWRENTGLGRSEQGPLVPVAAARNTGRTGLGRGRIPTRITHSVPPGRGRARGRGGHAPWCEALAGQTDRRRGGSAVAAQGKAQGSAGGYFSGQIRKSIADGGSLPRRAPPVPRDEHGAPVALSKKAILSRLRLEKRREEAIREEIYGSVEWPEGFFDK